MAKLELYYKNKGYERALSLAKERLSEKDPLKTAGNTGTVWTGERFEIPWLGRVIPLDEGTVEQQILWSHYMLSDGPKQPAGNYITYRQVPGAGIYNENFIKRCINPMVKAFAGDLDLFLHLGRAMGGSKASPGHMSFTVSALPYIPLTFILWQGDDEVPASGNILFDETAAKWLCAEDLVVLAGLPVYEMLRDGRRVADK